MVKPTDKRRDAKPAPGHGSTIRAVELETGISAMTLRDWERRFGFPAPERRPGSDRRLYSGADVARLKLVKQALAQGYRVGDVITKSNDELESIGTTRRLSTLRPAPDLARDGGFDALLTLLARERTEEFEAEIRLAAATYDPRRFVTDFAHPLMVAVGKAWVDAQISVRHEHLASECLMTAMRQLYAVLQPAGTRPVVLLGTLPDEPYSLPLLFVALYLSTLGAKTRLIGGNTPASELVDAAVAMRVDVVGVSVSPQIDRAVVRRDLRQLRETLPASVALWVGGAGAKHLALSREVAETVTSWDEIDMRVTALRGRRAS